VKVRAGSPWARWSRRAVTCSASRTRSLSPLLAARRRAPRDARGCRGRRAPARWRSPRRHGRVDGARDVHDVGSSKQRTTWQIASTSRMWARNWLPSPSPRDAPSTRPGDVHELDRGGHDLGGGGELAEALQAAVGHGHDAHVGVDRAEREVRRLCPAWETALNRVDLPTFGSPTSPTLSATSRHLARRLAPIPGAFRRRAALRWGRGPSVPTRPVAPVPQGPNRGRGPGREPRWRPVGSPGGRGYRPRRCVCSSRAAPPPTRAVCRPP
jgi:hypothetical protein